MTTTSSGFDKSDRHHQSVVGARERLALYPDQPISLCDAIVVELSRVLDVEVWTYDHHFDVMGAHVWR